MSRKSGSGSISDYNPKKRSKEVAKLYLRKMVHNHLEECEIESSKIKPVVFALDYKRACEDQEERLRYFEKITGNESTHPTRACARTNAAATEDPALASLLEIANEEKHNLVSNPPKMTKIEKMPKYDAWIPIRSNYRIDEDHELEPYMPYTDDKNESRRKARVIQDVMLRASGKSEVDFSDGEVDADGDFIIPEGDNKQWEFFSDYSMLKNVRKREASRRAIISIFEQYGSDEDVMEGLCEGLNLKPLRRLEKFVEITKKRYKTKSKTERTRRRRRETTNETMEVLRDPRDEENYVSPGSTTAQAMKYFCSVCQTFLCGQHDYQNTFPVRPIRDLYQEIRNQEILEKKIGACSNNCCFSREVIDEAEVKSEQWTKDELMILWEVLPLFSKDPCSLSIIIGSKTCREVQRKLTEKGEDNEYKWKQFMKKGDALKKVMKDKPMKRDRKKEVELDEDGNAEDGKYEFEPCFHEGDCDEKCTCVQGGYRCESTCGCNNVRFVAGAQRKGIARFIDRSRGFHGEHGLCSNTTPGCKCLTGNCTTNSCPCSMLKRACNPDICRDCEVDVLPQRGHSRRCANIPPLFAPRGRTIIGRSSIHGIGLFAAQPLLAGDLIGVYTGQLPNPRQVSLVDNLYDLKDRTFFFSLYKDKVIDAGLLGSKARFSNHAHENSKQANCKGYLVRSRGEGQIGLFASRSIAVGEEICFDYQFDEYDWMLKEGEDKSQKVEILEDEQEDRTNVRDVSSGPSKAGSSKKPVARQQNIYRKTKCKRR